MRPILRPIALLASLFLLTSCATHSSPPIPETHAVRPDPALCAKPSHEPKLPADAGLPVAVTDAEKAAMSAFLNWVSRLGDWGRALNVRAEKMAESTACRA